MSAPPKAFLGFVDDDGKFALTEPRAFRAHLQDLKGQEVVLMVKPRPRKRSLDQNAYWWAEPVKRLAEHCGYTPSQMHYALLGECFGYSNGPTGQPVPNKPSSSELTTQEFSQLIEWVLTWAPAELGVRIMAPNEWQDTEAA